MSEPTEAELIAALNAELETQGYSYRVEHGAHRGAETEAAVIRAIEGLVERTGKPAKEVAVSNESGVPLGTVKSALSRLVASGRLVGVGTIGYVVRKNA